MILEQFQNEYKEMKKNIFEQELQTIRHKDLEGNHIKLHEQSPDESVADLKERGRLNIEDQNKDVARIQSELNIGFT